VLELKLGLTEGAETAAVVFCCHNSDAYLPMIIGMDYTHNRRYGVYRQALYQLVLRAMHLHKSRLMLGFSAGTEKQKMGAAATNAWAYLHTTDSFQMEMLGTKPVLVKNEP